MAIGERLRAAREQLGLSFEQVYHQTRIHPDVLQAIEANRFEGLTEVYLKGFLKRYAECVRVDPREILAELPPRSTTTQSAWPPSRVASPAPRPLFRARRSTLVRVVTACAVAAIGFAMIHAKGGKGARRPRLERAPVAKSQAPRQAQAAKGAVPAAQVGMVEPKSRIQPVAPSAVGLPAPAPVTVPRVEQSPAKPFRFELQANQSVWAEIRVDGQVMFQGILPAGSREAWQAVAEANLDVNPAEGVELVVNGRPLGSPGKGFVKGFVVKENNQ